MREYQCSLCKQIVDDTIGGEYPCPECGMPMVHDPPAIDNVNEFLLAAATGEREACVETIAALRVELQASQAQRNALRASLLVVLDQVDYTNHACGLTEMVGAVLPIKIIERARDAIKVSR